MDTSVEPHWLYIARCGSEPNAFAAQSTDSDAIRDQIAATRDYSSGATVVSGYDENRHTAKSAVISRIAHGEVAFYKLIAP